MSVLPDSGTEAYAIGPVASADADEVFGVVSAEFTEAFGFCPLTVEDVRADLEVPQGSRSHQRLIRDRRDGVAVQWWAATLWAGDPTFHAWIRSDPRLARADGDELARLGWTTLLDWIAEVAPGGQDEVRIRSGCPANSDSAHARLSAAGFAHERTFWEMAGPVGEEAPRQPAVEGLTIVSTRDERTVHRVLNEAFAGHWGYEQLPFDEWLAVERAMAGYDPSLWRLALIEETPAAAMIMTRRAATEGALYVSELATLAPYRARGIASALLAHAFEVAAAEELRQVTLHVDSENRDNAPSVYRHAGFHVRCAFHAHTRTVRIDRDRPRV